MTIEEADKLTEPSRTVFLITEPYNLVDDYCNRPDHQEFSDFINSASDVEKAKIMCNATLKSINTERCKIIKSSKYFLLQRDKKCSAFENVRKVEQYFGLIK